VAIKVESTFRKFLNGTVFALTEMTHIWIFHAWVREPLPASNLILGRPRFPFVPIVSPACVVKVMVGTGETRELALGFEVLDFERLLAPQVFLSTLAICAQRTEIPAQKWFVFPIVGLTRRVFSAHK
jgi:hypothetical protein